MSVDAKFPSSNYTVISILFAVLFEGVAAQWCNPLTLQAEQSGELGSIPGRILPIDDYAKDGGKELFTKMHCVLIMNPQRFLHLGKKFLAAIFSVIVY